MSFDSNRYSSAEDAFRAWRDALTPLFDVAVPSSATLAGFRARMRTYHAGSMLLGRLESVAQHFHRSSTRIARDGVDHYLIQSIERGGHCGDANGKPLNVLAGDICVLDMAQPMHSLSQDFRHTALVIPRALLAPLLELPGAVHGEVIRGGTGLGLILGQHLESVYARASELSSEQARQILHATAMMISGCLGPAPRADTAASGPRTISLAGIKRHLDANLAAPELRPDLICQRFGISRPTLFRMFEPHGGFAHYLRERRLRQCFNDITSPAQAHRRISDIADSWGFHNEAVFSRAFRRMYKASPREIRQAAFGRHGDAEAAPRNADGPVDMEAWVRELGSDS